MTATPWFEGFESRRITTAGAEIFLRTGGDPAGTCHRDRPRVQKHHQSRAGVGRSG